MYTLLCTHTGIMAVTAAPTALSEIHPKGRQLLGLPLDFEAADRNDIQRRQHLASGHVLYGRGPLVPALAPHRSFIACL